jgi:hypothetical protein
MSRRQFLKLAALGASASAIGCTPTGKDDTAKELEHASLFVQDGAGAVERTVQAKLREQPSVEDFGAIGDGKTDDRATIQAALDWAGEHPGTRLRVPAKIFGLRGPLLIPQDVELLGELPGAGNHPLCGFRALAEFSSPYTMRYLCGSGIQEMNIAALLISKEWVGNSTFNQRLHLRDLYFDVDSLKDHRGAVIHGLLLANQQLDLHNVWVRSATGYGVWLNTQRPDGAFMDAIVDNVLRRVWVRGAGVGGATFATDAGTFRYGGFLLGALPGARDLSGAAEPPLATDGILDDCTVAVGPEVGVGCRGNGIHITNSAGWRLTGCHLNGAGRHGIVLDKAFQTELSGGYLDGWGVDVGDNEGTFGCVWCNSIVSTGPDADGGLIIAANRIRARAVRSAVGNRFVAVSLRSGATPTPRAVAVGNVVTKRRDATHAFAVFDFGRGGAGQLEVLVVANIASGASTIFLEAWNEASVRPHFSGNGFQHATAAPTAGWHPAGLKVSNTMPSAGGWSGWVNISAGEPGTWKGFGLVEA